jgi:uncharacterized membrane protein YoaK (UPF0700 family)
MILEHGPGRSLGVNAGLALALSVVAGAVNAIGFLALGSFSSHMTGTATGLGGALAGASSQLPGELVALMASFLAGAFAAGGLIEAAQLLGRARHGLGFVLEAGLLAACAGPLSDGEGRLRALMLLCAAMGLQNALSTHVSSAVVRSTHLTGLMTDLGLETAHLLATGNRGRSVPRLFLQTLTLAGFVGGAAAGATGYLSFGITVLFAPATGLVALAMLDVALYARARRARQGG